MATKVNLRKSEDGNLIKKPGSLAFGKCEECVTECPYCSWNCQSCSQCYSPCPGNDPGCASELCCTPSFYEVTVTGIVEPPSSCVGCYNGSIEDFSGPEVNGTFILPLVSGCRWEKKLGTVSWTAYDGSGVCAEESAEAVTGDLYMILTTPIGEDWRFEIEGRNFTVDGVGAPYPYGPAEEPANVTAYLQPSTGPDRLTSGSIYCNVTLSSTGKLWGDNEDGDYCQATGVGDVYGPYEISYNDSSATAEIVPCGIAPNDSQENLGDGPCGGAPVAECSEEGEACCTPDEMQVVFSGLAGCSGCRNVGGTYLKTDEIRDMNGAHTLAQSGCSWIKTVSDAHQYDVWDTDCSSVTSSNVTESITITLTKTATGWELTAVGATTGGEVFDGELEGIEEIFSCKDVPRIDNELQCAYDADPTDTSTLCGTGSATGSACP